MRVPVHFGDLGPSGMARRFGDDRLEVARAVLAAAEDRVGAKEAFREAAITGQAFVKDGRVLKSGEVLAPAKEEPPAPKPSKGGRPAKHVDKPWEAEGISRALWYRRRKATSA